MLEAGYGFPCQPYPTTTRPADMKVKTRKNYSVNYGCTDIMKNIIAQ